MKKTLIALLVLTSSAVYAANDGSLGATSTGDIDITLGKGDLVQISNLQDINFGGQATAPAAQFIDFCVYSSTGSYDIEANSSFPSGTDFQLANSGATEFITYNVEVNDAASGNLGDGVDLQNGQNSAKLNNASTTSLDCGGSNNARLFVDINTASFNTASSDFYSDNLELIVSPR